MKAKRFMLILCTIVLVPALLLSYAAMYIHPQIVWFTVFFGLAYFPILVLNIVLSFAWFFSSKKMFVAMLVVLLLGYEAHTATFALGKQNTKSNNGEIRLVTYNVKGFDFTNEQPLREPIMEAIAYCEADILCLQEFNTYHNKAGEPDNLNEIKKSTGLSHHYYHKSYENKKKTRSYGLIIFSRFPVISSGQVEYPSISKMNTTIWADVIVNSDTMRIYSSHLQSNQLTHSDFEFIGKTETGDTLGFDSRRVAGKFKNSYTMRAGQVDSIRKAMDNSPYPMVIAGDFNDTPVSYTYRTISAGMDDAFLKCSRGIGATYIPFPLVRIDYILYSPDLISARSYQRIRVKGSDHSMVKAILEFQP